MANFPPAGIGEDSSKFSLTFEDTTIKSETDGGYVYTRPRHGRRPRKTIKTGFTEISENQKIQLERFFQDRGMHTIFSYTLPDSGISVSVRFTGEMPNIKYVGMGGNHMYTIDTVEMTEV